MRDLSELNINEGGKPVERPAPSNEEIEAFQAYFGIELPDDYLKLLRYSNGGGPELDLIDPIGRPGASSYGVNSFFYLDGDRASYESLWFETEELRGYLGPNVLPVANDGGGNIFFLDLEKSPPEVNCCLLDENKVIVVSIAPSFEIFIDHLEFDPDMI